MSGLVFKFSVLLEHLVLMGRNSRWPTKANHGSRPCSSVMRRMRKNGFYLRNKSDSVAGVDGATDDDELAAEEGPEDQTEEGKTEGGEATQAGGDAAGKGKEGDAKGKGKDGKEPPKDAKAAKADAKAKEKEEEEKMSAPKGGKGKK